MFEKMDIKELLNTYKNVMTNEQKYLLEKKSIELITMGCKISQLKISYRWIEAFTKIVYSRGWIDLKMSHEEQMEGIGSIDSDAIYYLANKGKEVGIGTLYKLSTIDDEAVRQRAVTIIMETSVTDSKKELDRIISMAKSSKSRSLFDDFDS